MDTEWIDIAWDYTDKTINEKRKALDITNDADKKYSSLFQNIFRLEFYRRDMPSLGYQDVTIENILSDADSINSIIDIFDTLYSIHKNEGFNELWYKYFYFDDQVVGQDEKIRLFWKQKRMPVFELALNGALSVPETVYLYSEFLLYQKVYDENTKEKTINQWTVNKEFISIVFTTLVSSNSFSPFFQMFFLTPDCFFRCSYFHFPCEG